MPKTSQELLYYHESRFKLESILLIVKRTNLKMQARIDTNHHELGELDILCSKDKSVLTHPGNRLFREVIEDAKGPYGVAVDKSTKMKITKSVLDCIQKEHGCRFVKFDSNSAAWVELTRVESRDKVGHALRFAIKRSQTTVSKTPPQSSFSSRSIADETTVRKRSSELSPRKRSSITSVSSVVSATRTRTSFRTSVHTRNPSFSFRTSIEKVQSARENLYEIFRRQDELLEAWGKELEESAATLSPPCICNSDDIDVCIRQIVPDQTRSFSQS